MSGFEVLEKLAPWQPATYSGWEFTQVKFFYDVILGKMLQNTAQSIEDVEVPYLKAQHVQWNGVRIDDLPTMWASPWEIELLQIRKGDLLVCEGGEVGRAAIVSNQPPSSCIIQNALHLVRPKSSSNTHFLRYVLQHAVSYGWLDVLCNRATIAHFTVEKFKEMWIWIPPLPEQRAIAAYLDRKVADIDALLAAKTRLLALLAEKRRALITHAVTRGLNPDAPLRDSGVAWLGAVPAHWEVDVARWLFHAIDERSIDGEEDLLTVSHITGVTLRSEKDVNMFMAESKEGYKICRPGDLAINTLWAWMGAMGIASQTGIISPDYHVYRSVGRHEPAYLDYLVRMRVFAEEVTRYSKGVWSSRLRLYPEEFFQIMFPVPPLEEQQQIAAFLQRETAKLDDLAVAAERAIALLRERRAALIAAAVTGQIAVEVQDAA